MTSKINYFRLFNKPFELFLFTFYFLFFFNNNIVPTFLIERNDFSKLSLLSCVNPSHTLFFNLFFCSKMTV